MATLLIDSDILIDFSRGIASTATYLANAATINPLTIHGAFRDLNTPYVDDCG